MKKTIAALAVLFIVIGVFAACGKNPGDGTTTPVSTTLSEKEKTFSYMSIVGADSLTLLNDDSSTFQELKYPEDGSADFDFEYATANLQFKDLNFDGYGDIALATHADGENVYYFCWLYSTEKKQYIYNEQLSALTTISLDADEKQVISLQNAGTKNSEYICYKWDGDKLTEVKRIASDDTTSLSGISDAVSGSTLGTKPANAITTKKPSSDTNDTTASKKPSSSTTAQNKPGTPTTNAPDTTKKDNGIAIATDAGGWF